MIDFATVVPLGHQVGESPVWDERRDILFVADIPRGRVQQLKLDGTLVRTHQLDRPVGSFGLTESGRLIVGLGRAIVLFDPDSEEITHLADTPEPETNRLNDGKVGPDGNFYVGSMDDRPERARLGALYRFRAAEKRVEPIARDLIVSNGLAWSPDGRRMYHSDSQDALIDIYDFDPATGAMSNKARFAEVANETGRPDGGACDANGDYWSAGVSAGVLVRYAPDGMIVDRYKTPMTAPTMPCFCGPDLSLIAVTSLNRPSLVPHPTALDGALAIGKSPVKGTPIRRVPGL